MNLVSLLILPAVITLRHNGARYAIAGAALVVLLAASASPSASPMSWAAATCAGRADPEPAATRCRTSTEDRSAEQPDHGRS